MRKIIRVSRQMLAIGALHVVAASAQTAQDVPFVRTDSDTLNAGIVGSVACPVMETTDQTYERFELDLTDQATVDNMKATVAAGGAVSIEFSTFHQFQTVGNGSANYNVEILSLAVTRNGVRTVDRFVEADRSGSTSGGNNTDYALLFPGRLVDELAVGDRLTVRTTGAGVAISGGCNPSDQAIVQFNMMTGPLAPLLKIEP